MRRDCRNRIDETLSPKQLNLLKKLVLGRMAGEMLRRPEIVNIIGLTPEQANGLRIARKEAGERSQHDCQNTIDRLLDILDAQQRAQLRAYGGAFAKPLGRSRTGWSGITSEGGPRRGRLGRIARRRTSRLKGPYLNYLPFPFITSRSRVRPRTTRLKRISTKSAPRGCTASFTTKRKSLAKRCKVSQSTK